MRLQYRRACLVLAGMGGAAPLRVAGMLSDVRKPVNYWAAWSGTPVGQPWTPPRSALGAALAKEPKNLTAEDALTVAVGFGPFLPTMCTSDSLDASLQAAGITFKEWAAAYFTVRFPLAFCSSFQASVLRVLSRIRLDR